MKNALIADLTRLVSRLWKKLQVLKLEVQSINAAIKNLYNL